MDFWEDVYYYLGNVLMFTNGMYVSHLIGGYNSYVEIAHTLFYDEEA